MDMVDEETRSKFMSSVGQENTDVETVEIAGDILSRAPFDCEGK